METFIPVSNTEAISAPTEAQDLSGLVATTFFLRIRFGMVGNVKKVHGSILETDADKSMLSVSKTLMESSELEAIRKHDALLRKWLGNMCLPFLDWPGVMVLPKGLVKSAQAKLTQHKTEREELVAAFVSAYPTLKQEAEKQLGSLYNPMEYPSIEDVKEKFVFDWAYKSFGTPDSLKEIDPDLYTQQQEQAQANLVAATEEITAVMRQTLLQMVSHLQEKLTPTDNGKPRRLHESTIENLREFLNNFDIRNVTNDKDLAVEVAKAKSLLNGTNAASLRSSDEWREKIRAGMENITTSLGTMVSEKPARKFRTE